VRGRIFVFDTYNTKDVMSILQPLNGFMTGSTSVALARVLGHRRVLGG
jgi:hypothetical protein